MKTITTIAALALTTAAASATEVYLYPKFDRGRLREPAACQVDRVIDGDTVDLRCGPWFPRVRLHGVNAVETGVPGAVEAKAGFTAMLEDAGFLWGEVQYSDAYGRLVVVLTDRANADIACRMVAERLALEQTRYSRGRYEDCAP